MTYQDSLAVLSEDVQTRLAEWLEREDLTSAGLRSIMANEIARGRVQAVALADAAVAAELSRLWGKFVPALGLLDMASDREAGLASLAAVDEAMASDGWQLDAAVAVGVLGRSQVMETAQATYQTGMAEHGVEYWTRDVEPDACELCQDLSSGIMPVGTPMYHHKGCGCTQKPIK